MKFDAFDEEFRLIEDMLYKNGGPQSNSTTSTDEPANFSKVSVNSDDFNASLNCTTSTRHNDAQLHVSTSQPSPDLKKGAICSATSRPGNLEVIRHNPLFASLQTELAKECTPSNQTLPFSLLGTSMPQPPAETTTTTVNEQVAQQDAALRQEFATVKELENAEVKTLKELYTRESEKLENDRYRALCANIYYSSCKKSVNNYYDCERLVLIERVWKSLTLFKQSVRHDSGMVDSNDTENESNLSENAADSSDASGASKYDNSKEMNIADSEIKAEDCDSSWEKSDDIGAFFNTSSDSDNSYQSDCSSKKKKARGDDGSARKTISLEVTEIMQEWYNQNFDHPYPSDETVKDLAKRGSITVTQVKKWFANKRVRSFNTLSFNGSVHPARLRREKKQRVATSPESEEPVKSARVGLERSLDTSAVNVLSSWYYSHMDHPYPCQEEKLYLANVAGISIQQLNSWFNNKRNRTGNTRRLVPTYFTKLFDKNPTAAMEVLQRKRKMPQSAYEVEQFKQPCFIPTTMPYPTMPMYPSPSPVYMGHGLPMMQHQFGHL